MWGKGAMVAALAVAAAPHAEAFSHPGAAALARAPAGAVATPALRRGALVSYLATPAVLRASPALQMSAASDLCDVTIDMIKRIEKNLGDLDDIKLARVSARSFACAPFPRFALLCFHRRPAARARSFSLGAAPASVGQACRHQQSVEVVSLQVRARF